MDWLDKVSKKRSIIMENAYALGLLAPKMWQMR